MGRKNIKTVLIDNVYHIYATRIDNRPICCHNHKMQIKDYRVVNILLPSYQGKKVILHLKKQSIKLANTLINWKQEIINIIKYKINNGYVEGYNNKIKVIKRVSFGLRNYERFRKLIYLRI